MVRRRLARSREHAHALIAARRVLAGGALVDKSSRLVAREASLEVTGDPPRFVSRGGDKLAAALERFAIEAEGRRAIDVGASTGGFTDCLLQAGATAVVALDVGRGQLHPKLRGDPRVELHERCNIRTADLAPLGGAPLVVSDLSFISLRSVLRPLRALVEPGGDLVVLIKPQFEAGRPAVSRGRGVISDPQIWFDILCSVRDEVERQGGRIAAIMVSPLRGGAGNVEFLAHIRDQDGGGASAASDQALHAVVEQARSAGLP